MKGTIKTLNNQGHGTVTYDTDTEEGVQEAQKEIRVGNKQNAAFFDGTTKERIAGEVNLEEHEVVLVLPPMAGG